MPIPWYYPLALPELQRDRRSFARAVARLRWVVRRDGKASVVTTYLLHAMPDRVQIFRYALLTTSFVSLTR
jgi:hypothetical protein